MHWSGSPFPSDSDPLSRAKWANEVEDWVKDHLSEFIELLASDRFLAGLDAYWHGFLSHYGFIHRVYGDIDYQIVENLHPVGQITAVAVLVKDPQLHALIDSNRLSSMFPAMYVPYWPEGNGSSPEEPDRYDPNWSTLRTGEQGLSN